MVEFREQNFQLTKSHQKFRRDFSSQLARQCVRITLKFPAASLGKLYESLGLQRAGITLKLPATS
eukprot:8259216-Pyramimonas_sp.AAC.1